MGVTGHESVFHAVGDVPCWEPALEREPGGAHHTRAHPDTEVRVRPTAAHGADGCREVSVGEADIADRRGASEASKEVVPVRFPRLPAPTGVSPLHDCPSADVRSTHAVNPFVPADVPAGTAEPASSPSEDLGARGGQARPLHLPASRNLAAARGKSEERSLRAILECLM